MQLNTDEVKKISEVIKRSSSILIICHKAPDGDTLGAGLALFQVFQNMKKEQRIVCIDEPSEVFRFLPNIEKFQTEIIHLDYDAIFIMDAGAPHLTGFHETHPQLFDKSLEVVNVDHHQSNNLYGRYNLVMPETASATAVLYQLLNDLTIPIDRRIATCLLTGIYTDTGSFMHSNTSPEVLQIAGRLLAKGANLRSISKEIFNTTKISTMRLWGRVMKNAYQTPEGVTMSVVTQKDFEDTHADYSELSGAVDFVNSVPGAEYSVILTEREGKVKGSLRTLQNEVDVAEVASEFGGGGHTKAAGFTLPGYLEKEIRWKVVDKG